MSINLIILSPFSWVRCHYWIFLMSNKNICLIDYGMGNIKSVINAFKVLEQDLIVSSSADDINKSDALILPGVGAFEKAMVNLKI